MAASVSRLIEKIYAAVLDGSLWPKLIVDLAAITSSRNAWFNSVNRNLLPTGGISSDVPTIDLIGLQTNAIKAGNEFYEARKLIKDNSPFIGDELYSFPFERTHAYLHYLKPQKARYAMSVIVSNPEGGHVGLALTRTATQGPHGSDVSRLITRLIPHFASAMTLAQSFSRNRLYVDGAMQALSAATQAVFFLGPGGRVLFTNPAGDELLENVTSGLHLVDGRLESFSAWNSELRSLCDLAYHVCDHGLPLFARKRVERGPGQEPLTGLVFALRPSSFLFDFSEPRAMLVIVDPDLRNRHVIVTLRLKWRLTPTEAAVASEIGSGRRVEAVAKKFGVTKETVRTHLKRIFSKTGTSSQAELALFVSRLGTRFPVADWISDGM